VLELLFTVIAPLDWLLLNEKTVPFGNVVASGSLITCPPLPVTNCTGAEATVSVNGVADAVTLARVLKYALAEMFWFASRRTTEFAPVDTVTPVPPFATATVPVTFAAVPVVFWFRAGMSVARIARKLGAPSAAFGAA
jgi:hypothetical protein